MIYIYIYIWINLHFIYKKNYAPLFFHLVSISALCTVAFISTIANLLIFYCITDCTGILVFNNIVTDISLIY